MSPLNNTSFAYNWLHPPILKSTTQGLNSPLTIPPSDIPPSTSPAEAHAYVYRNGRSFQLFLSSDVSSRLLQDYFVPKSVIHCLSKSDIINHLISEPSLREKLFETAPRLFVMCLFLFPDYEQVLQKLINYGVDDKWLPLMVNDVKVSASESDWEFEKKLVSTLIPNQSRFMVSGRWLNSFQEEHGHKDGDGDMDEEEEEQIPVLTGQALPVWAMVNNGSAGSAGSRYRTWIGEEGMVRVHGDHDCLKKANTQGLYALRLIKPVSPFVSQTPSVIHSAITRSTALLRSLRHVSHPHITQHYKNFFHESTFYTILPVSSFRLDHFMSDPSSIRSITSPNHLRPIMAQIAHLAGALATIHDIPTSRSGSDNGGELSAAVNMKDKKKKMKKGFHLDIQPRNILVFTDNGGHDLYFEWTGFECSAVVEVAGTPDSEEPRVVPSAYRLFSTNMNRADNELYQKYLEASNEMYFPPESEDLSKPVTQAYDMWSMGVLMLDVLIWGLYGGRNLGIDDVFGEMGTQRPPSPLNTDSDSASPKVFKRTKTNAEPSNKKLYKFYAVNSNDEMNTNMDTDTDTNDAPTTNPIPENDDITATASTTTPKKNPEHQTELRLKPTIPDRITHILESIGFDAPRIKQWCICIISLLEPDPTRRLMTAGELAELLKPDSDTDMEVGGGGALLYVDEIRRLDETKVLESWYYERRRLVRYGGEV